MRRTTTTPTHFTNTPDYETQHLSQTTHLNEFWASSFMLCCKFCQHDLNWKHVNMYKDHFWTKARVVTRGKELGGWGNQISYGPIFLFKATLPHSSTLYLILFVHDSIRVCMLSTSQSATISTFSNNLEADDCIPPHTFPVLHACHTDVLIPHVFQQVTLALVLKVQSRHLLCVRVF